MRTARINGGRTRTMSVMPDVIAWAPVVYVANAYVNMNVPMNSTSSSMWIFCGQQALATTCHSMPPTSGLGQQTPQAARLPRRPVCHQAGG